MSEVVARKRVLYIEDELDILEHLVKHISTWGYEVLTACDGQEGLEKARSENPDLIILDLMLPKLDGYKVCRMLKFDEKYSHIPVILLTARDRQADRELAKSVGANAYITKPFDSKLLLGKISELLQGK